MKKILILINQYRFGLICLVILILFGLVLRKLPALTNPPLDQAYLQTQRQSQIINISVKAELRDQLERLVDTPVNTRPRGVGQSDPFNP